MIFYAAPLPQGNGDGSTPSNAADFQDFSTGGFWNTTVPSALLGSSLSVVLLPGTYRGNLHFNGLGHPDHTLTLKGMDRDTVVFNVDVPFPNSEVLLWTDCQNWVVRDFSLTGNAELGYVFRIRSSSQDFWVENIRWHDLPNVVFGASGSHNSFRTHFYNCRYERIGQTSGAHMMYHANNGEDVRVLNCHFEDCSGDYVRFRNNVDRGVVSGCLFKDTGTYPTSGNSLISRPFISMPLFNDCEPGTSNCPDPLSHSQYEYFATNYVFTHNSFQYPSKVTEGQRECIRFLHQGWDPPGKQHLLTASQGATLTGTDPAAKKTLLKNNLGIDMNKVIVHSNSFQNETSRFRFWSKAAYGAPSQGWDSFADIFDLANPSAPVPGRSAKYTRQLLTLHP